MERRVTHPDTDTYDVEVDLSGHASSAEIRGLLGDLDQARLGSRRKQLVLVDLSGLDVSELSDEDIEHLAGSVLERDWHGEPRAVAIIAPGGDLFDMAMRYRAHLGGSDSGRRVFRVRDEAIAWLDELGRG